MYNVGVVTKAHDSTILEIGCEEVSWPQVPIFHPGFLSMASQAMHEDNARFSGSQQSVAFLEGGRTPLQAFQRYTILTDRIWTYSCSTMLKADLATIIA